MPNDPSHDPSVWTVLKTLRWTTDYFKKNDIETPRVDAETLLAHSLRCERIDLYLQYDQPLNDAELTAFKRLIRRRVNREPVSYIIGYKEFWSLCYKVTPDVLIPRPDTECLVEKALARLPMTGSAWILELGVGSGAISVAMAHERPKCLFVATDRSFEAVKVARENASENQVGERIFFMVGNWLDPLLAGVPSFDMVVSNPPYIASDEMAALPPEIRKYEPFDALDGGHKGTDQIAAIVSQAHHLLKPGGLVFMEIGYDQSDAVVDLVQSSGSYDAVMVHKDLAGHHRVVQFRKKGPLKIAAPIGNT